MPFPLTPCGNRDAFLMSTHKKKTSTDDNL
jgi:hypothetical protein